MVALVAAYVLLLQALFSAYALGASADPLFAGPICGTQSADLAPLGKQPPVEHRIPDCCLAGCAMFGAALLPPPAAAPIHLTEHAGIDAGIPRGIEGDWRPRHGTPRHPRAPPFIA